MAEEKNIGSSRLLGTAGAQRAVDSLEAQVNKLAQSVAAAAAAFNAAAKTAGGATGRGTAWNTNNNRQGALNNGGQPVFAQFGGGRGTNGGGGIFGTARGQSPHPNGGSSGGAFVPSTNSKGMAVAATATGIAKALTNYGNKNMQTNMQMDMFGNYGAMAGGLGNGGYQATNNLARHLTFDNAFLGLNATDVAQGGYTNAYTFGNSQFGGKANPNYVQGQRQAYGFGYASPTLGATGAAQAAQQTYSSRSAAMSQALGLAPTILAGGQKNTMANVARSMMKTTFGSTSVSNKGLDASLQQGGSLSANMQYFGQQMGWNQNTVQEYENYIRGMNAATNSGMSSSQYDTLTQQAATGSQAQRKAAVSKLTKATGMGGSMFEAQRNLDATRLTRQDDILDTLAPAFEKATKVVDQFSQALTTLMKSTGLDKLVGGGAGIMSALSGGMSGISGGLGLGFGAMTAARMFRGAGGLFGGARGATQAGGGLINATRGASGAYNITSLGTPAAEAGVLGTAGTVGAAAAAVGTSAWLGTHADDKVTAHMSKWDMYKKAAGMALTSPANVGNYLNPIGQAALLGKYGKKGLKGLVGMFGGATGPVDGNQGGSGKSSKSTGSNSGANAAQVIGFAEEQIGDPYVWGGTGPDGWDCSGLIQWAYKKAGVNLPRVADAQQKMGQEVPTNKTQPGDLLFNGNPAHHVVMAIGGGKIIEAPRTGLNVRVRNFSPGEFTNARRILGSIGDMSSLTNGGGEPTDKLNDQRNTSGGGGGNTGGNLGGTSELSAIMSALGGGSHGGAFGLASQSQSASATSGTGDVGEAAIGDYNWGAIKGKSGTIPAPPGWVQTAIKKGMAADGVSGSAWARGLTTIAYRESGYDKTSRNTGDSNAAAGHPSEGLMQVIGPTFASFRSRKLPNDPMDPAASVAAAINWINKKYGGISHVQQGNPDLSPKGYASGAWSLDSDQSIQAHKGEMILPAKQAESIRAAIVNTMTTGVGNTGSSGKVVFESGAIVVQPSGNMSVAQAQNTGKMIMDAICSDKRLKELQVGN